jgi:hypothetical protein
MRLLLSSDPSFHLRYKENLLKIPYRSLFAIWIVNNIFHFVIQFLSLKSYYDSLTRKR